MDDYPLTVQELLQAGPTSSSQPVAVLPPSKKGFVSVPFYLRFAWQRNLHRTRSNEWCMETIVGQ